jgi:copper oxidase (laccase) domain-containing protein
MKTQIQIFEGNQEQGIFSSAKKFYKEDTTEEEIFNSIKEARIKLGKKYNFDGLKMFQVTQKMSDSDIYPDNKTIIIDESYMQKEDYFTEKLLADILIISNKYKKVALSHRMADCPVLILEDRKKGFTAIAHCGIYHINRGLPKALIKSMIFNCNSEPKDLYLYIGSYIHKESYIYDRYPKIATNKSIWKDAIEEQEDGYHIDLLKAIKNQIQEYDLGDIIVSNINTATTNNYASHYAANHGNNSKLGQNIVGFYYK